MIIDDETASELGRQLLHLADPDLDPFSDEAFPEAICVSMGKAAFKLVAPKVLEMIREPTPAMVDAGEGAIFDAKEMYQAMIDKMREDYGG